jgi:hypothetical protein
MGVNLFGRHPTTTGNISRGEPPVLRFGRKSAHRVRANAGRSTFSSTSDLEG